MRKGWSVTVVPNVVGGVDTGVHDLMFSYNGIEQYMYMVENIMNENIMERNNL